MKWKKVSEHPLPDITEGETIYILKVPYEGKITYTSTKSIKEYGMLNGITGCEWCEFNPDEIESAEQNEFPTYGDPRNIKEKTFAGVPCKLPDEIKSNDADINLDKVLNTALRSSVRIVNKEPSWEEKFRWETAARMLDNTLKPWMIDYNRTVKESIKISEVLIAELKKKIGDEHD